MELPILIAIPGCPQHQELETRCIQLESKDAQYRAAIRKKEVDYVRLQDSIRRAIKRDPYASGGGGAASGRLYSRGMESNFELSPGEATIENGQATLGVVLSDQTRQKAEDLEEENADLRSMLLKLQVKFIYFHWGMGGG